jgi:hypothetical protein
MTPRVLPDADRERLARLLGMLGSEFDGEVANAGRLADKLVRQHKLTWFDVVAAPALSAPPGTGPQPFAADIRQNWRPATQWCLQRGGALLRPKDRDFLKTIAGYAHKPSDAQLDWLGGLIDRVRAAESRP